MLCAGEEITMSGKQIPVDHQAEVGSPQDHDLQEIAPDLAYKRLTLVNVVYVGLPQARDRGWVLIDAGISGSAGAIQRGAKDRFGDKSRPAAIVLTHGHFDHVGALKKLAEEWDTEIFAHRLEEPYLNGRAAYP